MVYYKRIDIEYFGKYVYIIVFIIQEQSRYVSVCSQIKEMKLIFL